MNLHDDWGPQTGGSKLASVRCGEALLEPGEFFAMEGRFGEPDGELEIFRALGQSFAGEI